MGFLLQNHFSSPSQCLIGDALALFAMQKTSNTARSIPNSFFTLSSQCLSSYLAKSIFQQKGTFYFTNHHPRPKLKTLRRKNVCILMGQPVEGIDAAIQGIGLIIFIFLFFLPWAKTVCILLADF
jgi:hypothetical protein